MYAYGCSEAREQAPTRLPAEVIHPAQHARSQHHTQHFSKVTFAELFDLPTDVNVSTSSKKYRRPPKKMGAKKTVFTPPKKPLGGEKKNKNKNKKQKTSVRRHAFIAFFRYSRPAANVDA